MKKFLCVLCLLLPLFAFAASPLKLSGKDQKEMRKYTAARLSHNDALLVKITTILQLEEFIENNYIESKTGDQILKGTITAMLKNLDKYSFVMTQQNYQQVTSPTIAGVSNPALCFESIGEISYLKITTFMQLLTPDFEKDAKLIGHKGLILDLRDNRGGMIEYIAPILGYLIGAGKPYVKREVRDSETIINNTPTLAVKKPAGLGVVVLVNENTASASEILAGDIQVYGIGKVIGTKTFGKAVWGNIITTEPPLEALTLFITAGHYLLGDGTDIAKTDGVIPDIIVSQPGLSPEDYTGLDDQAFQQALRLLQQ